MYDTARRVELVKRQIRKNTRRRQKRGIGRLSAVCMLLFAVLLQTADRVIGQGQTDARGQLRCDAAAGGCGRLCAGGRRGVRGSRCADGRLYAAARTGKAKAKTRGGRNMKKFLSLLLSLCLLLGTLPLQVSAFAGDIFPSESTVKTVTLDDGSLSLQNRVHPYDVSQIVGKLCLPHGCARCKVR